MNDKDLRKQMYDIIFREFVGPDPITIHDPFFKLTDTKTSDLQTENGLDQAFTVGDSGPSIEKNIDISEQISNVSEKQASSGSIAKKVRLIQENGEEILTGDPPLMRYSAGILFPIGYTIDEVANSDTETNAENDSQDIERVSTIEPNSRKTGAREWVSDSEEVMNLSNSYRQSAISITVSAKLSAEINVAVNCAKYLSFEDGYYRFPISWANDDKPLFLPTIKQRVQRYNVAFNESQTTLEFLVTLRNINEQNGTGLFTFSLINRIRVESKNGDTGHKNEDCFFQVKFTLRAPDGFIPLLEPDRIFLNDEDYMSNRLLYRNIRNYAIGHGCSATWESENDIVNQIETSILPTYEIKPTIPSIIDGVSLDMYKMSDLGNFAEVIYEIGLLCNSYEAWIDGLELQLLKLNNDLLGTARRHISNCRSCHARMVEGMNLLRNDDKIRLCFQLMNRAMLLQQLHYNMPRRDWFELESGSLSLENQELPMPQIDRKDTWYKADSIVYGKWRPFQLAFILINLRSMSDRTCPDRKLVDLIWFPTGGGKTEAYLGLSAFTIFIRRLLDKTDSNTAIIMRYTLRLLSAQQYDRASAMICACESIRRERIDQMGLTRITIGMWVGGETTPNKHDNAVKAYKALYSNGTKEDYPFVMLKCPWCGAAIGPVKIRNGREHRIQGIELQRNHIQFKCSNRSCEFSRPDFPLPLTVVDEDIYNNPPTLIIGTVDKFAMLPYLPQAQSIFGIYGKERKTPPDLIIQDELHLISGPLGSMVGHYETLVDELCHDRHGHVVISPKIIASTATISRAKEQCSSLYDREPNQIVQFPPSGINAEDSFFAFIDQSRPGRMYVGILATAASSYSTANIRLYSALLYASKELSVSSEDERDPYWTNLGYFNSLRELGQTATWISSDIEEYLHTIYSRRKASEDPDYKLKRRYIYNYEELTSRIQSDQIPARLRSLSIRYPSKNTSQLPIDICLATNMISVGVDISRLGLMTVTGQPKTTAEYIQATSRIGRSADAPGIVFISYSPSKPRDRSHYEQFQSYHSKIYSHVEPTSVTPFSTPLRRRALHAILIGLIRINSSKDTYDDPQKGIIDHSIKNYMNIISERVKRVDQNEYESTVRQLEAIIKDWKNWSPQIYHDFNQTNELPLMVPAGYRRNIVWEGAGFETPTSMRSTDATCEVKLITNEYTRD